MLDGIIEELGNRSGIPGSFDLSAKHVRMQAKNPCSA